MTNIAIRGSGRAAVAAMLVIVTWSSPAVAAEDELPRFVIEEVEAFLKCGILAHGFLRVVCDDCQGANTP